MKTKSAKKLYKDFHGKKPKKNSSEIELGKFNNMVYLGRAHAVAYEAQKIHLGDTEKEIYEHEFEHDASLYWNGKVLIIAGKSIDVNKTGIIN